MPSKHWCAVAYALFVLSLLAAPLAGAQTAARFDLPSQPLADSLRAVASATHTNIAFDADVVAGIRAPALRGNQTVEQAVTKLLANSGLQFIRVDAHTIRVSRAANRNTSGQGSTLPQAAAAAAGPSEAKAEESGASEKSENGSPVQLSEVVVTGSHIHGAVNPSPTITITREDIDRSGYVDIGDVVRSLPENFSGGNNPQVYVPNTPTAGNLNPDGGSSPNLRGLGPTSTLTLVNGHRLGADGPVGAADISLIPLLAIDHVEVVTDSSSAAYGSDAVAGVVNFILRKDYEGAETSGSLGTATDGGGYERDVSQLAGHSWESGGVVAAYEHERQDAVWWNQRDFTATAFGPTSLLPESSRDSAFLSIHQDVWDSASIFADGLYTSRDMDTDFTYPPLYGGILLTADASVSEYLADVGVNVPISRGWQTTAYASTAAQRSFVDNTTLSPGTSTPAPYDLQFYKGYTRVAEVSADGPVSDIGTDSIRAAVGGGYRAESLGESGLEVLEASRGVRYAFAELSVPLAGTEALRSMHTLDLDVSGRYDGYTDIGGKFVPKIGLLAAPTPSVDLRATWSEAFLAPTLYDLYNPPLADVTALPDPLSATGSSIDILRLGGNPRLRAETATTWTTGFAWRPERWQGSSVQVSYFDILYRDRVLALVNTVTALTDPDNAPLVTRNPSAALQQEIIDSVGAGFNNFSGEPYDPSDIAAIVDGRYLNVAQQHTNGVDLLGTYRYSLHSGAINAFVNGSYLQIRQRITASAPEQELAGLAFSPPRWRERGGITWSDRGFSATVIANWTGQSLNTYIPTLPSVASWTTFDAQLSYTAPSGSVWAGVKASLSVQNMFDRDPPFVQFLNGVAIGFNYDSSNFGPLGRFVSLEISKAWLPAKGAE